MDGIDSFHFVLAPDLRQSLASAKARSDAQKPFLQGHKFQMKTCYFRVSGEASLNHFVQPAPEDEEIYCRQCYCD
jgi:hypothetical protein